MSSCVQRQLWQIEFVSTTELNLPLPRRRLLVRISRRVVFGTLEAVQQVLTACGWQINTAFIERVNLSIRQYVAAVGRRVTTLCKGDAGM